jgi:hypothetical protein
MMLKKIHPGINEPASLIDRGSLSEEYCAKKRFIKYNQTATRPVVKRNRRRDNINGERAREREKRSRRQGKRCCGGVGLGGENRNVAVLRVALCGVGRLHMQLGLARQASVTRYVLYHKS